MPQNPFMEPDADIDAVRAERIGEVVGFLNDEWPGVRWSAMDGNAGIKAEVTLNGLELQTALMIDLPQLVAYKGDAAADMVMHYCCKQIGMHVASKLFVVQQAALAEHLKNDDQNN